MDERVRDYIDSIPPEHRPLFERVQRLILAEQPNAEVVLSYKMPTYRIGKGKLHVGAWQHGLSIYGWPQGSADDFFTRHPKLRTSKGTIQLRSKDAANITDDELAGLIRAALGA